MSALIVTANPDPSSLTATVAAAIAEGARRAGVGAAIADLAAEGFDPRFTAGDRAAFLGTGPLPDDVAREQARIDAADALALVFPVYWWSMPALMKGWIDRVFGRDWAYSDRDGKVVGLLRERPVHLVALAGADQDGFDRHGHTASFDSQIVRGIFGYCGLRSVTTTMLYGVDDGDAARVRDHLRRAAALGEALATAQ
ncbi:NAD(P)H-dependent oxidoreductase [Azospirillum sp. ST 5-10]|uniref:NAD(P)H-dependent oxidoreductase n=1 Tax=unclassified Azospirillum TaxID=2630922 RepID=UPI003F4A50CE